MKRNSKIFWVIYCCGLVLMSLISVGIFYGLPTIAGGVLGTIAIWAFVPIWFMASRLMADSYKRLKEKENENNL